MKKVLLILFCLPNLGLAQNKPIGTLPFELKEDNRIYIKCKVNEGDTLLFLFDTGAGSTVINSSIVGKKINLTLDKEIDNIGSNGTDKVKASEGNKISFAGLAKDSIELLSIDYGQNSPFDGVFGSNIMKDYIIEIDYNKKQLRFFDPKTYGYKTALYQKYKMGTASHGDIYTIKASVVVNKKKHKGYFEMDTGGDAGINLTSPFVKQHAYDKTLKQIAATTTTGSDGSRITSPLVLLPEIRIGDLRFYNTPALLATNTAGIFASTEISGVIGNNFLKRFNIILDIPNRQVFLKPNNLLYTPYFDFLNK